MRLTSHLPNQFEKNNTRNLLHVLSNEGFQTTMSRLVDKLTLANTQNLINEVYDDFCCYMNGLAKSGRKVKSTRKQSKTMCKPFWNRELDHLWKDMRMAEKRFLGSKGLNKQQLRHEFKSKQHQFDKKLRGYKRRHQRGLALQIESSQTHNPQTFWSLINKLGPQKVKKIPEKGVLG